MMFGLMIGFIMIVGMGILTLVFFRGGGAGTGI